MSETFNASLEAARMRSAARSQVHQDDIAEGPNSVSGIFTELQPNKAHLQAVADALEKGNSGRTSAPQAEIERHQGEVVCISFQAGQLDFDKNPRKFTVCDLNASYRKMVDEDAAKKKGQ